MQKKNTKNYANDTKHTRAHSHYEHLRKLFHASKCTTNPHTACAHVTYGYNSHYACLWLRCVGKKNLHFKRAKKDTNNAP